MSMRYPDFQGEVVLLAKIHYANTNLATELQAVATALASDTTTHDRTIQTPPAGLFSDAPAAGQSRLTRDLLNLVNIAKAGNLPTPSIIAAIDGVAGVLFKPGNIDVPAVYGPTISQRWYGWPIVNLHPGKLGGNAHLRMRINGLEAGDQRRHECQHLHAGQLATLAHQVTCIVTATNATPPPTAAPISNQISVA